MGSHQQVLEPFKFITIKTTMFYEIQKSQSLNKLKAINPHSTIKFTDNARISLSGRNKDYSDEIDSDQHMEPELLSMADALTTEYGYDAGTG